MDEIKDEFQRKATESQINNFGQTPTQVRTFPQLSHLPTDPFPASQKTAPKEKFRRKFHPFHFSQSQIINCLFHASEF